MAQVYLVTSEVVRKDGIIIFDPVTDTEVYSSYFSALRLLCYMRKFALKDGQKVVFNANKQRNKYGREHMCEMRFIRELTYSRFRISRINTEGWH